MNIMGECNTLVNAMLIFPKLTAQMTAPLVVLASDSCFDSRCSKCSTLHALIKAAYPVATRCVTLEHATILREGLNDIAAAPAILQF